VGPRYAWAGTLLTILTLPTLVSLPQSTASSVLYGISRHKGLVGLSLLNALVNLGLSLWWARRFGIVGVAWGTALPLALIGGVATMVYACRALEMPIGRYLWHGLLQPGLVSLAFLVPALAAQALWHPVGWIPLFGTCAACWVVFAACAWAFGVPASDRARWARLVPGLLGGRAAAETGR
jgi:O-antigen/teichoic acid export membrane protein